MPKKKKLKTDADKAAEKDTAPAVWQGGTDPGRTEPVEQGAEAGMYAAHAARSAVHREVDQYEDENVGVQALSEGEKAAGNVRDISKSRYARKLKKKAKMQGKKGAKTAKSSAEADCGTRCRRIRHRRGRLQLAFPLAAETGHPAKATMPPPVRARRRRPQAAKRHPTVHLPPGPAWNRPSTKENRWSAPQSKACQCRQEQRTRSFDRGRFSFAHAAGDVRLFVLRHSLFRRHAGIRADHLHRRGPGHPGRRTGLQEAGKGTGQKDQAHPHRPSRLQRVPVPPRPHRA